MTQSEAIKEIFARHLAAKGQSNIESVQHDKGTLTVNFQTGRITNTSNGSEPFYKDPFSEFESSNLIIQEMAKPGIWREWWNEQQGNTDGNTRDEKRGD